MTVLETKELLELIGSFGKNVNSQTFCKRIQKEKASPIVLQGINIGEVFDAMEVVKGPNIGITLPLSNIEFENCTFNDSLSKGKFEGCNLVIALSDTKLSNCIFIDCDLTIDALRNKNDFDTVNFVNCAIGSSRFNGELKNTTFENCKLQGTKFNGSTFSDVKFLSDCNLEYTVFDGTTLGTVDFSNSNLNSASFTNIQKVDISFRSDAVIHNIRLDAANHRRDEEFNYRFKWHLTNWEFQKLLGNAPVFTASWIGLAFITLMLSSINYLNETEILNTISTYPIPTPNRLVILMFAILFLFIGSVIFKAACPSDVQEYSLSKWVREMEKSRIHFEHMKIKNLKSRRASFFLLFSGGLVVFYFVLERLFGIIWALIT